MKNITNLITKTAKNTLVVFALLFSSILVAQEPTTTPQDSTATQTGFALGKIKLKDPSSIILKYTYDPKIDRYIYTESVANFDIRYPLILTPKQYRELLLKESMKGYFKEKLDAISGKKDGSEDGQKNLLPKFYINSNFFESIFGGNTIEVIPQGSVAMDLGIRFQKNDNPALSPRNRSNLSFDFDQRISLSLLGKVGERLKVTANYDTESTFDFQNQIKLEYTPTEDDILQKIEVGNVSMPLNSSLITGAQSLFGVKTELQFGKTRITGVFSEQRSQTRTITSEGGGTIEEFELFALDYDEDRHFFLSQYFRDRYDVALENYPFENTPVEITRVEVWVTNRSARTENVRNIVGLQDLGESNPDKVRTSQASFFNTANPNALPDNENNKYDPEAIGTTGSVLNDQIRDIATVQLGFPAAANAQEGFDYVYLENARKLNENEYQISTKLGYISLNQRLSNDEVLAVAFQYTANGQVHQVGEFANGGIDATQVTNTDPSGNPTQIENQNLVVKLLKSSITEVADPIWDLMMKNIYATNAYQLSPDDFRLNILYTDPSPVNYITAAEGGPALPADIADEILLKVFNLDRLDIYQNPQAGGDGFFDYYPGITVDQEFGRIIFTKVEPFGDYLFEKLRNAASENYDIPANYNANQTKYVYRSMYVETKAGALDDAELNKFQLKGRYKSESGDGIPLGAFNVPRGSVVVTAGGRVLQEGIDYTVNYQLGRVQILDEALKASNTPIDVSVENNSLFGQQNKRFTGINVEHQFNKNFLLGATFLNLNERPITQKANYGSEPVNNSIFGINGNYSTEVPFLTRLVNKLPNIDTDVVSNLSVRGEFAYLSPGSPKNADFAGESTAYVDDFEGAQSTIDIKSPLGWFLSSVPGTQGNILGDNLGGQFSNDQAVGFQRAKLAWYTIDPVFYGNRAPGGISVDELSTNETRRVFVDEIFPQTDIAIGQTNLQTTLDLAFYPDERGPYNNNPNFNGQLPESNFGGITRPVTTTNFEQANVEFIQFWVLDPTYDENGNPDASISGELVFNIGNISEDVLKDGRKQYENGLPEAGASNTLVTQTIWGEVPQAQSLVYAFDADDANRQVQDIGLDGLDDVGEAQIYDVYSGEADPAADNYEYFLNASGDVLERYKNFNGTQGNSPIAVTDTNRGSTTVPDVEDINRDQTMNTIDNYYQFRIPINSTIGTSTPYIIEERFTNPAVPNESSVQARWLQVKIPIADFNRSADATVTPDEKIPLNDLRSIRFIRMYMTGFDQPVVLRFATLDLIRGDWRRYNLTLQENGDDPQTGGDEATQFDVNTVNIEENSNKDPIGYVTPPGVVREQLNNNNTVLRQNEQSLAMSICELESGDSRGVFKNIDIDLRQYKKLKMFVHAESLIGQSNQLTDQQAVAFLRIGNDFTQNYYQVEIPLNVTLDNESSPEDVWRNEFDIPLSLLTRIKAANFNNALGASEAAYYNENAEPITNQFADYGPDERMRIAIIGNPTIGRVRSMMVGIKNSTAQSLDATDTPVGGQLICGEFWFNELRLSELENEGGWAAVGSLDANIADFANVSATGRISTVGFGTLEQSPNERSREDVKQYDIVTNVNVGQLLPKKWGVKIPFNYSIGEEIITPEFDPFYQDIRLEDRLDLAETQAEKDRINEEAISYTKRKSINFIGVRKERGAEQKPRFYDVENLTLSYSYNEIEHHDYEIKSLRDQNVRAGFDYNYNFQPKSIEPFKKSDSLFTGKYWKWLKDFNFNPLPTSISLNSNITRSFNDQVYRDPLLPDAELENLPRLQQRNFLFDWSYAVNYNLTNSLRFNFTAANNNIIQNYFDEDGDVDVDYGIWDGFWDVGDPNTHTQSLQLTYELPLNKIPTFSFINATYTYTGDFNWQRGSDVLQEVSGERLNTIQNANTHNINASLDMTKFYKYIGLVRKRKGNRKTNLRGGNKTKPGPGTPGDAIADKNKKSNSKGVGAKIFNTAVDILGSVKRINISYSENNGKVLPGYTPSIGFIGTLKPSIGFVFGSQADVRYEAARQGYLTEFSEFNQQFTQVHNKTLDVTALVEPLRDLKIDIIANRNYSENFSEQFNVQNGEYISLSPNGAGNTFGNFGISTLLIKTAFKQSDESNSETFSQFEDNREIIARRLAIANGQPLTDTDGDGFPDGFGKTNQAVLLPAFLAAYSGKDANDIKLGAFRDVPLPNWTIKYTGLMRLKWFKKRFKRFSLSHGYRSSYTINSFRNNLDYDAANPFAASNLDQGENFHNQNIFSNINLVEQFNPLIRVDFEMKNSIKILAEVKRDRALSLSFDNNLLTEVAGNEYIMGLGYRFKDVRIDTRIAGKKTTIKGDLNLKADLSLRDNITIIRSLDLFSNQVTAGQTLWSLKFTADYALSKNLTALFYYDHTFSKFAVSTAFPQTTIRSGFTLRYNFGN